MCLRFSLAVVVIMDKDLHLALNDNYHSVPICGTLHNCIAPTTLQAYFESNLDNFANYIIMIM